MWEDRSGPPPAAQHRFKPFLTFEPYVAKISTRLRAGETARRWTSSARASRSEGF